MPQPDIGRSFRDVDGSNEPMAFVAHLDEARDILAALKRQAFDALALAAGDAVLDGRVVVTEPDWDTLIIYSDDLGMAPRVARAQADSIRHPA